MKSILVVLLLMFVPLTSFASGEEEGEGTANAGPGKAVTEFSSEDGFKLSDKASLNIGVTFQSIQGTGPWKIPSTAIVRLKQSSGVYRKADGWISFVLVKVLQKAGPSTLIQSEDLQGGDQVAISGVSFLRMTDADLNSGTVDSCAH